VETDRIELQSPLLGLRLELQAPIAVTLTGETPLTQGVALRSPVDLEVLE
jgi:hypothetical protein